MSEANISRKTNLVAFLSLASSTSTLICCTLPALLVALGMGATLVGMVQVFPQLVFFSEQKIWVFSGVALLLAINGFYLYKTKDICPIDPVLGRQCQRAKKVSRGIYFFSLSVFTLGFLITFVVPKFL